MSRSTPASSKARMSRSKNVVVRPGYWLVKTASFMRPGRPAISAPMWRLPECGEQSLRDLLGRCSAGAEGEHNRAAFRGERGDHPPERRAEGCREREDLRVALVSHR